MDNNEWHESSDKGGAPLFERSAGKFWLVAQQDDDEGRDWGAFVDVQERPTTRVSISESRGHSTREAAQAAAEAMLASLVAPLLATARAEAALAEREACAERIKQAADQLDAAAARIGELVAERDMAQAMIDELNGDLALVARERNEARAVLATARAEAALAEREACAQWFDDRAASHERSATLVTGNPASFGGGSVAQELAESLTTAGAQARLDARVIRARTAPATLSSDTLAAIAEARGLRLVEPEHLAELEALRAAVDEETALDRERSEHGCGDASCVVERATGMTTNGGCRCGRRALRAALQRARKELAERGGKDGAK